MIPFGSSGEENIPGAEQSAAAPASSQPSSAIERGPDSSWGSSTSFMSSVPIGWKLTLVMLAVATFVSLGEIVLFSIQQERASMESKRSRIRVAADIVGANSISALTFKDRDTGSEILRSLVSAPAIRSAYLLDKDGGMFAAYLRPGEPLSAPIAAPGESFELISRDAYVLFQPIVFNGIPVGSIHLTSDLSDIKAQRQKTFFLGGAALLAFFLLSFCLAYWLRLVIIQPLRDLEGAMQRITALRDFSFRTPKRTNDEFGALTERFNVMLAEIEQRDSEIAKQMELLQRTNAELDQFVYVASHDLKAPLRAVENLAQLIEKATKDALPPDKREYLDLMRSRVRRMEALLDDLLAYSRVGRVGAPAENVKVASLVRKVVDLLAPPPSFSVQISDQLPAIYGSRTPLEQVFRNLIGNALKHHNRKDGVIIVSCTDSDGFVEFSVCDDGPGIAPEYHEKIFQMFQTLRPRDEVEGSGMGLALVKKIVEDQKGRVTIRSAEGQGACFIFTWPKRPIA